MTLRVSFYYKIYYVGNVIRVLRWCLLIHLQPCYAGCNIRQSHQSLSDFQSLLKLCLNSFETTASKMIWWRSMQCYVFQPMDIVRNSFSITLSWESNLNQAFKLYFIIHLWHEVDAWDMKCSKSGSIKDSTIDICGASCGCYSSLHSA